MSSEFVNILKTKILNIHESISLHVRTSDFFLHFFATIIKDSYHGEKNKTHTIIVMIIIIIYSLTFVDREFFGSEENTQNREKIHKCCI